MQEILLDYEIYVIYSIVVGLISYVINNLLHVCNVKHYVKEHDKQVIKLD